MRQIRRYGWRPDLPDFRDFKFLQRLGPTTKLPAAVDLTKHMPGIYDQGDTGSCTGNAIAAAIEFCLRKQRLSEYVPSRLFIYYNERLLEGTTSEDAGAEIRDGIKSVAAQGVCSESPQPTGVATWPFNINLLKVKPPPECYASALKNIVKTYSRVDQTLAGLRGCLAAGLPFVFGFTVYDAFESQAVASSGALNLPTAHESVVGGHAVLAVGYDDSTRRFIVRNSWGRGWGQHGYFTMPYDYVLNPDLADDFWHIDVV